MVHLKKRKVSARNFKSKDERDILDAIEKKKGLPISAKQKKKVAREGEASETPDHLSAIPLQRVEMRNVKMFEEVGTDVKGPYHGATIITFVEKATGKKFKKLLEGKETLADSIDEFLKMIGDKGYRLHTLRSDKEAVYNTPGLAKIL